MTWLDDATIEGNLVHVAIGQAIQTARLNRAIDQASTVVLGILDPARELLRSPLWRQASRLEADGRTYVLVRSERPAQNKFTLTFEDASVYVLRQDDTQLVSPKRETWIDFVTRMAAHRGIKVFAPEAQTAIGLNVAVPNRGSTPSSPTTGAFEAGTTPTVTNHGGSPPAAGARPWTPANGEQLRSLTIALNTATDLCKRNHLSADQTAAVMAAMVAAGTDESGWYKSSHNHDQGGHFGVFQQSPQYYTAPDNVEIATHEFLVGARTWGPPVTYTALPGTASMIGILRGAQTDDATIGRLIALVQRPGPASKFGPVYAQFVAEARQTVGFWTGAPSSTGLTTPHSTAAATIGLWRRGQAQAFETTWDCAQRLASDAGYRCFIGPGTPLGIDEDILWLVSDAWLFNRAAVAVLAENDGAVETITWSIDQGRRRPAGSSQRAPMDTATVAALDTWDVEPGSVIRLDDQGPASTGPGKWLVTNWTRDAVAPDSTITLGKPIEKLAPPTTTSPTAAPGTPATGDSTTQPPGQHFRVPGGLVQPIPKGPWQAKIVQGIHSSGGLSGHTSPVDGRVWAQLDAVDFGALAGAPVVAMENGEIAYLSGHPASAGIFGIQKAFGRSIYLKGDSGATYFITHLDDRLLVGLHQRVQAGQQLATVGDFIKASGGATPNHTHVGVNPPASGHPDIRDLLAAPQAVRA